MKRIFLFLLSAIFLYSCFSEKKGMQSKNKEEDKDKYDNPWGRAQQEYDKTLDPVLGYVPYNRLAAAIEHTEALKRMPSIERNYLPLTWEPRGPIFDSVGPSNGNGRGGSGANRNVGGFTSGRIRAFLLDTLNDPTGNTAFTGGVAGGVWRCTNFLDAEPNWTEVNGFYSNIAIGSICQDPTNPQVFYVATGEATSNADAVFGDGVYKSTDGGLNFTRLPSTTSFLRNYKISCDAAGNVYLACRITTLPVLQTQGLFRSKNGGATWEDITPNNLTSGNNTCTDFQITASGKLNAVFGYVTGAAASTALANHRYTADPANVTPATWSNSTGFRVTQGVCRTEMAVHNEVLYAITINAAYNTDSCYRSLDGGATWTKQNTTVLPSGLGSQQGWYNLCLAINPNNTNELIAGGLDAYRSVNGGANWTRITFWVTTSPYVHADHHYHMYWIKDGQTRIIMATDGGIFYSTNNGSTFVNKNKNLDIKQFYAASIHPAAGSPYLIGGTQDNGVHQLNNPGVSYSIEVTGGDGCFTHINQLNPNIQYGSYVYNQYRRSTNGGATWSNVNFSGSVGLFVNPFDSDDAQNIIYCSNGPLSQIRRWLNSHNSSTNASIQFSAATLGATNVSLTAIKVSPYTTNRVFFGTNNGRVFRLENANTVVTATVDANTTQISSGAFPTGTINCVNVGTDDNTIIAVYTNYGVSSVWLTNDGGANWSPIEGDLPDMPVRWAMFEPGDNNKIYLATDAGIFTTTNINGASTQWLPEPGYPPVRTDMLKMRTSDSTIVAATHGRGLWTAKIPPCNTNAISLQPQNQAVCAPATASFSVGITGPSTIYQWQISTNGGSTWTDIPGATSASYTTAATTFAMNGYRYRCIIDTYCSGLLTSDGGILTVNTAPALATCTPNVTVNNAPNQCGANVTYTAPVFSGSPAPVVTYSHASGSFFPVGTTTVTATANNLCGTASCNFTVTVVDAQAPTASCPAAIVVNTDPNQCYATVATPNPVTADNCAVTRVTWTLSGATSGSSPATGINYVGTRQFNLTGATGTGVTTVTYTVADAAGNTTTCSYTVTVNDASIPVISAQPQTKFVCNGSDASFSVTASAGAGNPLAYQWQQWNGTAWVNITGATSSVLTIPGVSFAQNTNSYRCVLTGRCSVVNSGFASLYINPLPTVTLVTAIPPALIPGQSLSISSTVSMPGGTYAWYRNGALLTSPLQQGPVLSGITVDHTGTYRLVYTDPNGCVNSSADLVVSAKASDNLWIYPVPNNGQFQVRFYNQPNESATIRVFDSKGAKVYEHTAITTAAYSRIDINLGQAIADGTYLVELVNSSGKRVGAKRIIVRKRP